jgi:WD40 repeat protein
LDRVVETIGEDGRGVLADVLRVLYPRDRKEKALAAFRQFRMAVDEAAKDAGVRFSLKGDGQTRSEPSEREVWFEGEDRVAEAVTRMVEAEIAGVERSPQDVLRPLRLFVSYAHVDAVEAGKLLEKLKVYCGVAAWDDSAIEAGDVWRASIQRAMEECDVALLLLSPGFLASAFIRDVELPQLRERCIPVLLKPVGSLDTRGLQERQWFGYNGKAFIDCVNVRAREAFALALYEQAASKNKPAFAEELRRAIGEVEARFVNTEGVETTFSKGLDEAPEVDPRRRKDAIAFLMEWLADETAERYCAPLGEYGMGKTTTCKWLAKMLLESRDGLPLPIYLDLRHVGKSAVRELVLDEILELILKRSWKPGDAAGLTARDVIGLVRNEGALVIWDGLDEVLVHLDASAGQMFTRQLFRILQGTPKGRMLVSCRTHYFRTLRDQQTHFRAEDRDGVRKEDYRAPFLLLPFTEAQIEKYLKKTFVDEDPKRLMETLRSVHNLAEMAERPYTLSLVVEQFGRIERWKAEGRKVTGLTLNREMVLSWLERDAGKEKLTKDHKQALMEELAAAMWRSGAKSWAVGHVEQWLIDYLEARPRLAAHYRGTAPELLKEDLRTATFLVREGEDQFRFAHTSLQEYFLAGYLRRALVEGRPEAWDLPRVSAETLDFLGQWLDEKALESLGRLRDEYRAQASELAFAYCQLAWRKGYPAVSGAGFQLPGADLHDLEITGTLPGINVRGARLWNTKWRNCNLDGAVFEEVDAFRTEWLSCRLEGTSWGGASLEGSFFRDCRLSGVSFEGAKCDRTFWVGCAGICGPRRCEGEWRLVEETPYSSWVNDCQWSPVGKRIASASRDGTVRIWDGALGGILCLLRGHNSSVTRCAWSSDGGQLASVATDGTICVWDARTGVAVSGWRGHENSVLGCAWAPDGARLATSSTDGTMRIWDRSGLLKPTVEIPELVSCSWSPDGERIASARIGGELSVWDTRSYRLVGRMMCARILRDCKWSPTGQLLLTGGDGMLEIWDAHSYGRLLAIPNARIVLRCGWFPDAERVVSAGSPAVRTWDARYGTCLTTVEAVANACSWSPDGRRIVSGFAGLSLGDAATGTRLWGSRDTSLRKGRVNDKLEWLPFEALP